VHLKRLAIFAILGLLLVAACGGSDEVTSLSDAADADDGTDAELTGFVVSVSGDTKLCEVLLESFPPQCGGANVVVVGLNLGALDAQTEGNVTWTDGTVTLSGTIEDGALEVDD
jgi:ABC-type glycerol-3-phosphate transport system substrate-binding protein